jgi:peptide/nickel transport system permease protein
MKWTWGYLLRRIGYSAIALFGLSVLVFIIARVLPGNPVRLALGPHASQATVNMLAAQLHLNDPIWLQYIYWIEGIFSGNWGISLFTHRNVLTDVEAFLPATLELLLAAAIIDIAIAVPMGVIAGRYENTLVDNAVRVISYIGIAIPAFVVAIFLQHAFPSYVGQLSPGIPLPPHLTGLTLIDALLSGQLGTAWNALLHLILPAFALALGPIAQEARIMRSSVVENLRRDYTLAEISHGLPERVITLKYLMKPSLIPTITIYALDISALIANAFLVELIFNWGGFSQYGLNAILSKDLNAIVVVVMIAGILFVLSNLLVDVTVGYLDPRIRLQSRSDE